jgi:hypothetical protein
MIVSSARTSQLAKTSTVVATGLTWGVCAGDYGMGLLLVPVMAAGVWWASRAPRARAQETSARCHLARQWLHLNKTNTAIVQVNVSIFVLLRCRRSV